MEGPPSMNYCKEEWQKFGAFHLRGSARLAGPSPTGTRAAGEHRYYLAYDRAEVIAKKSSRFNIIHGDEVIDH